MQFRTTMGIKNGKNSKRSLKKHLKYKKLKYDLKSKHIFYIRINQKKYIKIKSKIFKLIIKSNYKKKLRKFNKKPINIGNK